jgi:putative ABC transport system permease protein
MFRIHFVSAIRTLLKNRGVSIINVCGLTMGLTAFLFIMHYLFYEVSFDSFFPESKSIYRVNSDIKTGEELYTSPAKKMSPGLRQTAMPISRAALSGSRRLNLLSRVYYGLMKDLKKFFLSISQKGQ